MRRYHLIFPILLIFFLFFIPVLQAQNQAPPEWAECAACHTIGKGKLIGPDLKGVTERMDEKWIYNFIRSSQTMVKNGDPDAVKLFNEYNKVPMPDHKNFTDAQIKGLLEYIKNYKEEAVSQPSAQEQPSDTAAKVTESERLREVHDQYGPGNTKPTFLVFFILLLLALFDLAVTKFVKARFIHIIIILVSIFIIGNIAYLEAKELGRQQGYSPDQPINFSHKVHAGQAQIPCLYCHSTAMESKSAGIPGVNVCMNCHNVIKKGKNTGEAEIAKVIASWNDKKPIEWIKVDNLPDHVFFSHAQHVNAGKRQCQECHGKVQEMDRIVQVEDLAMGWCLDCHRRTNVQFTENPFYRKYEKLNEELKEGKRTGVKVSEVGGTNCQQCHY